MVELIECLPNALRDAAPRFTPISSGMSGARVIRVDAGNQTVLLRIAANHGANHGVNHDSNLDATGAGFEAWRRQRRIEAAAGEAGVAPRVLHVDEKRGAVISEYVIDRGFPMLLMATETRGRAMALLGDLFRRLHALPIPPEAPGVPDREPRVEIERAFDALTRHGAPLPRFVVDAVARELAAAPVPRAPRVLGHNDPNPGNVIYDGERLLLVDWDVAGAAHPLYDLAVAAMFSRLDDDACRALLAAYRPAGADGDVDADLASLRSFRNTSALLCGLTLASLAARDGCALDASATLESAPSLGDFYARLRSGAVDPGTAAGKAAFALALLKESAATTTR
jgi:hypothetical protein